MDIFCVEMMLLLAVVISLIAQSVSFCDLNGSSLKCDGESLENVVSQYSSIKDTLKSITINKCNLEKLEDNSVPFTQAERLQISCNLQELKPQSLQGLTQLKHLNLSNNKLARIPRNFFKNIPSVQTLDLSKNLLRNPDSKFLADLPQIKLLDLRHNRIKNIGPNALESNTLEELYLSHNNINLMIAGIYDDLPQLKTLDIQNVKLDGIMMNLFEELVTLQKLIIKENNLHDFNSSVLRNNKQLVYLDMRYCELTQIETVTFSSMVHLQTLKLAGNNVAELQNGVFDQLLVLEDLDLSNMSLTSIQHGLLEKNTKLKKLDLSLNKLTRVDLPSLQGLKYINFAENYLSEFPLGLNFLKELRVINASFNNIERMGISQWGQLEVLDLRANRLDYLEPDTFRGVQSGLQLMDLRDNRLGFIDLSVFESFRDLRVFEFTGNPFECKCLDELLTFLWVTRLRYTKGGFFTGEKQICVVGGDDSCRYNKSNVKMYYDRFHIEN